jgi:hypothetical protein
MMVTMNIASPYIKGRPLNRVASYAATLALALFLSISVSDYALADITCDYNGATTINGQPATLQDTVNIECPANGPPGCLPNPNTGIVPPGPVTSCVLAGLDPPLQLRPDAGTGISFSGSGYGLRGMGIIPYALDDAGNRANGGNIKRTQMPNGAIIFSLPNPASPGSKATWVTDPKTGITTINGSNGTIEMADIFGNPIPGVPAFGGLTASAVQALGKVGQINININAKMNANLNLGLVKTDSLTGNLSLDASGNSVVVPPLTLTASGGIPSLPCGGAIPLLSGPTSMELNGTVQGDIGAAAVASYSASTPTARNFTKMPHSNIPATNLDMTNGTSASTSFPAQPFINFPPLPGVSYGNIISMGAIKVGPSPAEVKLLHISIPYYNMTSFVANAQKGVSLTINASASASLTGQVSYSASDFLPAIESELSLPKFITVLPPLNKPGQPLVNMKKGYYAEAHVMSPISPVVRIPSMTIPLANLALNTDATLTAHLQAAGLLNANANAAAAAAASANAAANGSINGSLNGSINGGMNGNVSGSGNVSGGGAASGGGGISAGGSTGNGGGGGGGGGGYENPIANMCANGGLTGLAGSKLAAVVSGFGGDCDTISNATSSGGIKLTGGGLTGNKNGNGGFNGNGTGGNGSGNGSIKPGFTPTNGAGYTFDPSSCSFSGSATGGGTGTITGTGTGTGTGTLTGTGTGTGTIGGGGGKGINQGGNAGGTAGGGAGGLGAGGGLTNPTGGGTGGTGNGGGGTGNNNGGAGFTASFGSSVVSNASASGNANFAVINNLLGSISCPNTVLNVPTGSMQLVMGPVGVSANASGGASGKVSANGNVTASGNGNAKVTGGGR